MFMGVAVGAFILGQDPAELTPDSLVHIEQEAMVEQVAPVEIPARNINSAPSEVAGFNTFEDLDFGFSIDYPESWEAQTPNFDLVAAMFFSPQTGDQNTFTNVNVTVDDATSIGDISLQEYADQSLAQLETILPQYLLVEQGASNLGEYEGHYMAARYVEGEIEFELMSVFAVVGDRIFAITHTYLPDYKELSNSLVDQMVDSFSLL